MRKMNGERQFVTLYGNSMSLKPRLFFTLSQSSLPLLNGLQALGKPEPF
jgi:hypothetical protein